MMLGGAREHALKLIESYARDAMWLDPRSEVFSAWLKANDAAFAQLSDIERDPPAGVVENHSDGWPDKFGLIGPREVSFQYRLCWQRTHVRMSEDFLAVSKAHAEFCQLPEVRRVCTDLTVLSESLTGLVEYWFETCGYTVDKDLHLVYVQGYEALFFSAEQAYD
ncbi:hypothetical protein [Paraburkholderia humisilvae]|uniref:Uncharacterized protein n=1 Tax=Paraburkholderia humisilvae TaxID=627669 RepID=A0A6J5DLZ2_9BURK|nr:hypothetical protein [Paraburkholderia humisilvae]CAB3754487.1 hypothetical protein LMG29542_02365 [Paraburkholderia humisilvae]